MQPSICSQVVRVVRAKQPEGTPWQLSVGLGRVTPESRDGWVMPESRVGRVAPESVRTGGDTPASAGSPSIIAASKRSTPPSGPRSIGGAGPSHAARASAASAAA